MDPDIRRISNAGYRLGVAVNAGGALVGFDWTDKNGDRHPLFRDWEASGWDGGPLPGPSSFPMIPFANRIDGGRFTFEGQSIAVPVNRPETDVAIHGFSYALPWRVVEEAQGRLVIAQEVENTRSPYIYAAEQAFSLSSEGLAMDLTVINRSDRTLPFGFGHHPWLEGDGGTVVSFAASHAFSVDARTLPISPIPAETIADFRHGVDVGQAQGIDTCFAGWDGAALVEWRRRKVRLRVETAGAFCCLHVYTPAGQDVFCLEPVTHVPNVHNRRDLAGYGDLAAVPPGGSLTGHLRLSAESMLP